MTDAAVAGDETGAEAPTKKGKGGLVLLLAGVLALGGGGFFATWSGMADPILGATAGDPHGDAHGGEHASVDAAHGSSHGASDEHDGAVTGPAYVELDPLMVSVGGSGSIRQLRFRAYLQVAGGQDAAVAGLQPRILDIFATYLRAVPIDRLEDPTALLRLRAQLLRRVQLLAGPDTVEDLLIIDFVVT